MKNLIIIATLFTIMAPTAHSGEYYFEDRNNLYLVEEMEEPGNGVHVTVTINGGCTGTVSSSRKSWSEITEHGPTMEIRSLEVGNTEVFDAFGHALQFTCSESGRMVVEESSRALVEERRW